MKESSSNKDTKTQNLTTYAGLMKFSGRQNKDKIKFDKIWGYRNEEIPLKQGRRNSKLNHSPWTDEIFQNSQI